MAKTSKAVEKPVEKPSKNATKQAKKPRAGKGGVIPPEDRQFGKKNGNPRSNGHWRPEDTISFQLKKIAKMTKKEFEKFKSSPDLTMAQLKAIRMFEINDNYERTELIATSEILDRTEGKAKQSIEMEIEETARNPFEGLSEAELRQILEK